MHVRRHGEERYIIEISKLIELNSLFANVYICRFESNFYSDSLFSDMGFNLPDSISNLGLGRKSDYLAGRYCADHSLKDLGILGFSVIPDNNGSPKWPKGVFGSISHSSGAAVSVALRSEDWCGVGIDIEKISAASAVIIAKGVLSSHERALLVNHIDLQDEMAVLMFSIKESFYKAVFSLVKSYINFDAVIIQEIDFMRSTFRLCVEYDLCETIVKGLSFSGEFIIKDNYVVSLLRISSQQLHAY